MQGEAYEQVKVRLAAIDAPESHQRFGQRSKQALSALCYMEQARISPRDVDRYGRTVADVRCRGEDAGRRQVDGGWAWVYEQYAARDDRALFKVQYTARAQHLGLWADREPVAPWEWQKAQRSAGDAGGCWGLQRPAEQPSTSQGASAILVTFVLWACLRLML